MTVIILFMVAMGYVDISTILTMKEQNFLSDGKVLYVEMSIE